jgi:hypothetical protein
MDKSLTELGTVLEVEAAHTARPERIVVRVRVLHGDPRIGMHFEDSSCGELWKLVGFGSLHPEAPVEDGNHMLLCFANTTGQRKLESGVRLVERTS